MNYAKLSPLCLFISMQLMSPAVIAAKEVPSVIVGDTEFKLEANGRDRIYLYQSNKLIKTCRLDRPADEDFFRSSFDKQAIIVDTHGYLLIDDLLKCNDSKYLKAHKTPEVGWLTDINVKHKIYVAVDLLYSPPTTCIATVGRLPSPRNIISMPGTDVGNKRDKRGWSIDCVSEPLISPDGRYVSLENIDCRDSGATGVWDIKKNKKVIFSRGVWDIEKNKKVTFSSKDFKKKEEESYFTGKEIKLAEKEIETKCNALFEDHSSGANQKQ